MFYYIPTKNVSPNSALVVGARSKEIGDRVKQLQNILLVPWNLLYILGHDYNNFPSSLLMISLLLGGNSIFVGPSPPAAISHSDTCDTITVVWGGGGCSKYHKSEYELDSFYFGDYDYHSFNGIGGLYYKKKNINNPEFLH